MCLFMQQLSNFGCGLVLDDRTVPQIYVAKCHNTFGMRMFSACVRGSFDFAVQKPFYALYLTKRVSSLCHST